MYEPYQRAKRGLIVAVIAAVLTGTMLALPIVQNSPKMELFVTVATGFHLAVASLCIYAMAVNPPPSPVRAYSEDQ